MKQSMHQVDFRGMLQANWVAAGQAIADQLPCRSTHASQEADSIVSGAPKATVSGSLE